jgi:hypothetical protein
MVINGERPPRPEAMDFTPRIAFDDLWTLVEACWTQLPNERPTGSEVQIEILNLQRRNITCPVANNDRSSTTPEARITPRRKHTCQDCDKTFNSVSLLNDHVQVFHMNIREC